MAYLISDNYIRANQSGWGLASDGVTSWSHLRGTGVLNISSNVGTFSQSTPGNLDDIQAGTQTYTDVDISQSWQFGLDTSERVAITLRMSADGLNKYKVMLAGADNLFKLVRTNSDTDTVLASVAATTDSTSIWHMRAQMIGNVLYGKYWKSPNREPVWTLTYTDTSGSAINSAGLVGIWIRGTTTAQKYSQYLVYNPDAQMLYDDVQAMYTRLKNATVSSKLQLLSKTFFPPSQVLNENTVPGELDALLTGETISQLHVMRTVADVNAFQNTNG